MTMAKKTLSKPQPKVADETGANTERKLVVEDLDINTLTPFEGHPFSIYQNERLDDMVASIESSGVLVPILVRRKPDTDTPTLEILAGHNRVNASKIAGKTTIPSIILDNISDEEAMAYVIETNLMQRSFTDMNHSEKATVIAMHHAKMFSQGKRNDILHLLHQMENPEESPSRKLGKIANKPTVHAKNETFLQVGEKIESDDTDEEISHTDKRIAEMYSLSKNTVSRYLRIHQLHTPLKEMLDIGFIAFIPAVTVSFLKDKEQIMLADYLDEGVGRLDMKKAEMLRDSSKQGKLNRKRMVEILNGKALPKKEKAPTVKVRNEVYSRYFTNNQSVKEVENIVEEALALYFNNQG